MNLQEIPGEVVSLSLSRMEPEMFIMPGLKVIEAKLDGLLYHPHERPSAKCVSVLTKEAFERAEQGRHFKFLWDGSCISKLYDFSDGQNPRP